MSFSITYYSFNKARADKVWQRFFATDLKMIQKQLSLYNKESDEVCSKLDALKEKRAQKGTEYFLQEFNNFTDYERGDISKRPLEGPLREKLSEILELKKLIAEQLGNDGFPTILSLFEKKIGESELIRALMDQDLDVGSVSFDLEDTHLEEDFLKLIGSLNNGIDLPFSTKISTKDWINLMKNVTENDVNEFLGTLIDEAKQPGSKMDANAVIGFRASFIDYIRGVESLIKDCEENGSIMVINQNGEELSYDGLPLEQSPLRTRAVEHYKQIREKLE